MKTLLRIDASTRKNGSHSRMIADYYQKKWSETHSKGGVIIRDLADDPVPHLTADTIEAFHETSNTPSQEEIISDSLIQELKAADYLLISSPLYNLTLPSTLKAYFDYVTRAGLTFNVQENSYTGLLSGKSAVVITARGGFSIDGIIDDFQTSYLKSILSLIGINPVEIISLEGTSLDESERIQYVKKAKGQIDRLFIQHTQPTWKGTFTVDEKQSIKTLRDGQAKAIVDGDAKAYANLCTDDIQLMIPGYDIISGREQFLMNEQALFRHSKFAAFKKYPNKIERSGNIVVETGFQEITMTHSVNKEGSIYSAQQKYLHVFRLSKKGWRYAVLMSNHCEQP